VNVIFKIIETGLCVYVILTTIDCPLMAKRPPNTSSGCEPTAVFDRRLYREATDAKAFKQIEELEQKADVFLYILTLDKLHCSIDHKFCKSPNKSSGFSQEELKRLLKSRVKRKKRNLLLVQLSDIRSDGIARPYTPRLIQLETDRVDQLAEFLNELNFERTIVFLPQMEKEPEKAIRRSVDSFYILMDRYRFKN